MIFGRSIAAVKEILFLLVRLAQGKALDEARRLRLARTPRNPKKVEKQVTCRLHCEHRALEFEEIVKKVWGT